MVHFLPCTHEYPCDECQTRPDHREDGAPDEYDPTDLTHAGLLTFGASHLSLVGGADDVSRHPTNCPSDARFTPMYVVLHNLTKPF